MGLGGVSLAGCLGRRGWIGELCAHFRLQYAAGLVVLGIASAALGWWPGACLAGAAALLNLWRVPSLYAIRRSPSASGPTVRVLFANVLHSNHRPARLLDLLKAHAPDIVILAEFSPTWLPALSSLSPAYPVSTFHTYRTSYTIGLMSRVPVDDLRIVHPGPQGLPTLVGCAHVGARRLTIIGTHPLSPTTPRRARLRDEQLRTLARLAAAEPGPVLLIGDLNTTSWSPIFGDVLRAGGLRDSREGFGLQTTWPAPLRWCGLSIDHGLVSPGVTVRRREVGPWIGSDHFPILLDLDLGVGG